MMARRMMRKHHVRCRAGEKVEITSKPYLSLSGFVACAYAVKYLNDKTEPEGKFIPFPTAANDPLVIADTVQNYIDNIAWWKVIQ